MTCMDCQAVLAGDERFRPVCGCKLSVPTKPEPVQSQVIVDTTPAMASPPPRQIPIAPMSPQHIPATNPLLAPAAPLPPVRHVGRARRRKRRSVSDAASHWCPRLPSFFFAVWGPMCLAPPLPLDHELVIGKSPDCGLVIGSDEFVSRQHVRISLTDGKPHRQDLGMRLVLSCDFAAPPLWNREMSWWSATASFGLKSSKTKRSCREPVSEQWSNHPGPLSGRGSRLPLLAKQRFTRAAK